jgi:hypothetical protein
MVSDLRHLDGFDAETQRILIADAILSPATQRTKSASGSTDSIERGAGALPQKQNPADLRGLAVQRTR